MVMEMSLPIIICEYLYAETSQFGIKYSITDPYVVKEFNALYRSIHMT